MRKIITIDGPSGVGKGTIGVRLARKLGYAYLDSGALYRLAGLAIRDAKLDQAPAAVQANLVTQLNIRFVSSEANGTMIYLDDREVSQMIRQEEIGQIASQIATLPEIRTALLSFQREFSQPQGLVADGRDMGTVVFPTAQVKIFLDADVRVRAKRRFKQLKELGEYDTLANLERTLAERDVRDRMRALSPLKPASDAVIINSDNLSIEAVLEKVYALIPTDF